jgi:hypothetical protein
VELERLAERREEGARAGSCAGGAASHPHRPVRRTRGRRPPPAAVRSVRCGEKNEHLGFPQQPASIYM